MSAVAEAAEALRAAVATVPELRAYTDPGASVDPPAAVLGPPSLVFDGYQAAPTTARFLLYVLVTADERALERLWDLVPLVVSAVDGVPDAVVLRADPGVFQAGGVDLPAYDVQIEVAL